MWRRAKHTWSARGRYRDMVRHLTHRERLIWARHALRSTASGSVVSRPDEFTIHSRQTFETSHARPKAPLARELRLTSRTFTNTAIVIQGPLVQASDFTLETAKHYRANFPHCPLVIVVWDSEPESAVKRLHALGAQVVRVERPHDPGAANVNLQQTSVSAGLRVADEIGCDFAIRTRSDQRFYSDHAVSFLHALLDSFLPPRAGAASRIVATSLDTFRFRLYGLSDQFHFGRTQDLIKFWDVPTESSFGHELSGRANTARSLQLPEVLLTTNYLTRTNWSLKWTLDDWWSALSDRFIVIDASAIDLLWPKYTSREYRWRRYGALSPLEELDFADWLSLYAYADRQTGSRYDNMLDHNDWWDTGD